MVLYALRGELADPLPKSDSGISVVTEIELLGFPSVTMEEEFAIRFLVRDLTVVPLDDRVKEAAIDLIRTKRLNLPDAIILATAVVSGAELLTNDRDLLAKSTVPCRALRRI